MNQRQRVCTELQFVEKEGRRLLQARWANITHDVGGNQIIGRQGEWEDIPMGEDTRRPKFPPVMICTKDIYAATDMVRMAGIKHHDWLFINDPNKLSGIYSGTIYMAPGFRLCPYHEAIAERARLNGIGVVYGTPPEETP